MPVMQDKLIAFQVPHAENDNDAGGKPPRGPRPVEQLTDQELQNLIENFARNGVVESPWHRLVDVKFELFSRKMNGMDGALVTGLILGLASASPVSRVSYGQLNRAVFGEDISGPGAVARLMRALGAAVAYCIKCQLPIVTAVVTRKDGTQSKKAIVNLFGAAKFLGAVGDVDPSLYVQEQAARTVALLCKSAELKAA